MERGVTESDLKFSIQDIDAMYERVHALASPLRLKILSILSTAGSLYITEIAERLSVPQSTAALNVRVLEQAGLIVTEVQPGTRGGIRRCSHVVDSVYLKLSGDDNAPKQKHAVDMPIGGFTDCEVVPVCGLASSDGIIEQYKPSAFYLPSRFSAQLIWLSRGYLEYRFPNHMLMGVKLEKMEVSFEACSEAPNFCNDWPSDISVWINGVKLGDWTCPGDFGGRQGNYSPSWWPLNSTHFGLLTTWAVTDKGATLDGKPLSKVSLRDLDLLREGGIRLRIGIDPDAQHVGGMNLFGEAFGDYPQPIRMEFTFSES